MVSQSLCTLHRPSCQLATWLTVLNFNYFLSVSAVITANEFRGCRDSVFANIADGPPFMRANVLLRDHILNLIGH